MNTVTYEHFPGDEVYVVINDNTVRKGLILQVDIRIYERDGFVAEDLVYIVLLVKDNDSVKVDPDLTFNNLDDALEKVRDNVEGLINVDIT